MHNRRDLVVAMSIAEVFLLLLFVVWIGSRAKEGPLDIGELQAEILRLKATVRQQDERISELERWKSAYEAFIQTLGHPLPESIKELEDRTKKNSSGGKGTDLPPCSPGTNRLLVARVANGIVQLRFVNAFGKFPYQNGQTLSGDETEPAITAIVGYQTEQKCRFHYRFEFATDADYRLGRQRFDRVFYPDGEEQLPQNP